MANLSAAIFLASAVQSLVVYAVMGRAIDDEHTNGHENEISGIHAVFTVNQDASGKMNPGVFDKVNSASEAACSNHATSESSLSLISEQIDRDLKNSLTEEKYIWEITAGSGPRSIHMVDNTMRVNHRAGGAEQQYEADCTGQKIRVKVTKLE
ncbi:uncharacterized protein LOC129596073 [Paramacrobiotus metropolitanus]|uniref:uncharacterized protein LOC129596073 n=1 Tax=Paramacrobiotus metropolitanus TaxID=2943436 RepID=UPI0024458ACF|nr:uncharacterized protein LOC129596073 [Paramacrobiotus metropolitanus]